MNPEFKKHLDEIRDYVQGVSPEARAPLMSALVERLLAEFKPTHMSHWNDVFRTSGKPAVKAPEPDSIPQ